MRRLQRIREKIEGMTAGELAGDAFLRARRKASRKISRIVDSPKTTYVSEASLQRSLDGKSITDIAARIRQRPGHSLLNGLADVTSTVAAIKQLFPEATEQSRTEAEAILNHRITLFNRPFDLGPEIDWHRDPQVQARWPLVHFTRVPLVLGKGADVRMVWELNRLHHLVTLGRAYLLTNDERYTEEFLLQITSWHEDNPPRFGVNWTVAMEAGIRAVNIVAALEMFRGSPMVTNEAIALILRLLIAHGRFIKDNLEFSHRVASNHYLSDLIGLFVIGTTLPELRQSRGWATFSARELLKEIDRQVLSDGVDYEGAIGYHRLVLEIFALFFSISQSNGIEISSPYRERLEAMFEFVRNYLKPDGTAPMLGDSDDGRLIKFRTRPADDHSYMMSIAAILLENGIFKQSGHIDEEALWWCGTDGLKTFDRLSINAETLASCAFPEAQIFIQRSENQGQDREPLYAIIDCGDHGTRGRGSHAHSDALSIELFAFNRTFLRDPGTYVYTASEEHRNLFRSTAYHNTVRVDGEEISQVNEGELFAFASNVRPKVNLWESNADRDVLDAEHYGYQRLASPVTHRRIITLDKREGYWIIRDIFTGAGRHRFEFFFNFDVGIECRIDVDQRVIAQDGRNALAIVPESGHRFETKAETPWLSLAYGTRIRSSVIIYSLNAEVPFENVVHLIPYKVGDEERLGPLGR